MRMIKSIIKKVLPVPIISIIRSTRKIPLRLKTLEENQARLLKQTAYSNLDMDQGTQKLANKEFKIFSQNGEDGILLYIFSKIGTTNKKCIEFGIDDGKECNTANLITNFGWKALLIEGDKKNVLAARSYYKKKNITNKPLIVHSFVTKDNINSLILKNGFEKEIDLLSIDIDGNDYWVWEAITAASPRVVVIEYNSFFGPDRSITVTYDHLFERFKKHRSGKYYGASLRALQKLGLEKNYDLIGCDSCGVNAFFVRKDLVQKKFKKHSTGKLFQHKQGHNKNSIDKIFNLIKNLPYREI